MRDTHGATRRHPQRALTARAVQTAGATDRPRRLADGGGLYLVVWPSGAKSWVLRTVVKGKRSDIGLGGASVVSLANARDEAARLRRIARAGGDPLDERRHERRVVPSFKTAATQVHAAHAATFRNAKHRKQWLASATWTIPAHRMKAGVDHRVPLAARCIEMLERARTLSPRDRYVFPGRTADRPLSNIVFLMTLRRLGRRDVTTHGFRSSFRDWAAERTNFPRAACEAALAHTLRDKTEAAYHRTDLFERRRDLMASWAAFATAEPASVVSIRA